MAFLEQLAARTAWKTFAPIAGAAALVAAGVAAAVTYEHQAPWALGPRLARTEAALKLQTNATTAANELAAGWAASAHQGEALRSREHAQAVASLSAAAQACDVRVAEAKRAALAIHTLVTKEVPHDANGCPRRALIDPGELRNALGAAAAPR